MLVDAAEGLDAEVLHPLDSAPLATDTPLPGLPATWQLEQSAPEVLAASRRLLALQQMLGGGLPGPQSSSGAFGDSANGASGSFGGFVAGTGVGSSGGGGGSGGIDVVWMVVREPGLLSADLTQLTGRLMDMKLATFGMGVDVLKLVEAQPALLLSDNWQLDLQAAPQQNGSGASQAASAVSQPSHGSDAAMPQRSPGAGLPSAAGSNGSSTGSSSASARGQGTQGAAAPAALGASAPAAAAAPPQPLEAAGAVQQLVQAWQYGIASDGDAEWASRLAQLATYRSRHGDTCVGFRDGDDPELSRWATKQRADRRRGELAAGRLEQLEALGFHFDADEAEWCRWFSELLAFKAATGHASPMPLVTGGDMYLINWCSVQRIARRSSVLSESRIQRLDDAGFDWTGADPLS